MLCMYRWAFLFDKVLVVCKRGNIIRVSQYFNYLHSTYNYLLSIYNYLHNIIDIISYKTKY